MCGEFTMRTFLLPAVLAAALLPAAQSTRALRPDPPHACDNCEEMNRPREPFRVFGNTYYVGVNDISSVLITNGRESILLDGGLTQSAALIDANIRKLGFKTEDIRLILNSHAHYDHAGGIAALQRVSGAAVAASAAGAKAIERGDPTEDDPQFPLGRKVNGFPPVAGVRQVKNGETVRVGDLAVTAHLTPGHTPGSTTWTWKSCEGTRCYNIVYADSLNSVSAPDFRFSQNASVVSAFRASIASVAALPCDIILAVHPSAADMDGKLQRRASHPAADPFVTPDGCRTYAEQAGKRLDARIAEEQKTKAPR